MVVMVVMCTIRNGNDRSSGRRHVNKSVATATTHSTKMSQRNQREPRMPISRALIKIENNDTRVNIGKSGPKAAGIRRAQNWVVTGD